MEWFVRILTVVLWVAATLFVAVLFAAGLSFDSLVSLLGSERLETVEAGLVGTVAVCSGPIAWYEFRMNKAQETEYGEWTGNAALYSLRHHPFPVLLVRPGSVLRPLSLATVLLRSPDARVELRRN
jgi:hypothetical protein